MKNLRVAILAGALFLPGAGRAGDFKQAKFTQVVNSVEVISFGQARHSAAVNDVFKMPDVLRTGPASRAELLAEDNTLTRVGADTVFSFDPASRTLDLQQGSLLFHSPHGKGGGTVHTGSATASVLGTTIIVTTTPNGGFKVLALEGQAEVRFLNGQHLTLTPGQMTFVLPGGGISPIVVFRLDKETSGSLLVNGFPDPLPSWPKIEGEITRQLLLLLNGRLQDVGLVVGDNATPQTVQVRMDILNNPADNQQTSPFGSDAAIIGPDHTPNQPLPVNYDPPAMPLDPGHLETAPFAYPGLPAFTDGLLFLGIVNPAAGFVGNNLDIDTAKIDLSPYAASPDFDFMAAGDLKIWQSANFTPSFQTGVGVGNFGKIIAPAFKVSGGPDAISLLAGGQMLVAPGSTLEADTKLFGVVANGFGALDPVTGLADADYPNTLLNVSLVNQAGDVDLLSLSDLAIEGLNSAYTVQAAGEANIEGEGALTLGAVAPAAPQDGGHNVAIAGYLGANVTAQNDLNLFDAEVSSRGGSVALNSVAGSINLNSASYLYAGGAVRLGADQNIAIADAEITAAGGGVSIATSGLPPSPAAVKRQDVVPAITIGPIISIAGSSIAANNGDVEIQNGTSQTPPPLLPSRANNLNVTGGSAVAANNGNVTLTTDEGVNLAGSTVSASGCGGTTGNVTVNAGAGITVDGAALTADAAAGTIALNSVSRTTAIVDGASAQSFYLNVNSPDGILIDGRSGGGVHLTGHTMNLTGSLTDATKGVTMKSADLTAYATVNVSAHTVSLTDVAFGSGSYANFHTFYGALAANPNTGASAQPGYLNFINGVTYGGALVTSANQSTYVNPAGGPGVYVSPLH